MSEEQLKSALNAALTEDASESIDEENSDDLIQKPEEKEEESEARSLNKTEQEAFETGKWVPKDEFDGSPENWIPAGTFLRIHNLHKEFSDYKSQSEREKNTERKDFEERTKLLNETHKKHVEILRSDLEKKRDAAVEEGDLDLFRDNQKQIDELNQHDQKLEAQPQQNNKIHPDLDEWVKRNHWVNTDRPKRDYADALLTDYAEKNPSSTMSQALLHIDEELERRFPDTKPVNPRRESASVVESSSAKTSATKRTTKLSWSDLTRDEMNFYDVASSLFVDRKTGKPSKDVYLKIVADKRI